MNGLWGALVGVAQVLLIVLRLLGVVAWPWWVVVLPMEAIVLGVVAAVVYLLTTKSNPFQ